MVQTPEDIYSIAQRFFEQDYHDRGMVKWQGFYLSDHTEDADKHTQNQRLRSKLKLQEHQSIEYISEQLKYAFEGQITVTVQLSVIDETGVTSEFITGKIRGYTDRNTVLINESDVSINDINHIMLNN